MDLTLNIIIVICGFFLLFIPLFADLRKTIEVKNRKGILLKVEKKGVTKYGKWVIFIFIFALGLGIYKEIRDGKSKNKLSNLLNEQDTSIKNIKNDLKTQIFRDSIGYIELVNRDSLRFKKIEDSLRKFNILIDSNFNVIKMQPFTPGITFRNVTANNNRKNGFEIHYNSPPPIKH